MGQVMLTGFNFAQKYFAFCNGQLLPINQNTALFSLLGTYYGGNGVTNFALPDLRGRTPVGFGSSLDPSWQPSPYPLGLVAGTETVTLLQSQVPPHSHQVNATNTGGDNRNPSGRLYAMPTSTATPPTPPTPYGATTQSVPLSPTSVSPVGGNQPHNNMQPFQALTFVIALSGIYPSRN